MEEEPGGFEVGNSPPDPGLAEDSTCVAVELKLIVLKPIELDGPLGQVGI